MSRVYKSASESRECVIKQKDLAQEVFAIMARIDDAVAAGLLETNVFDSPMTDLENIDSFSDISQTFESTGSVTVADPENDSIVTSGDTIKVNDIDVEFRPILKGTASNPVLTTGDSLTINGNQYYFRGRAVGSVENPVFATGSKIKVNNVAVDIWNIAYGSIANPYVNAGTNIIINFNAVQFGNAYNNQVDFSDITILTDTFNNINQFSDGDKVQLSTSDAPAPLVNNDVYWIVNSTASDFQLSLTEGGSPIDITTQGSGTHTFTKVFDLTDIITAINDAGLPFIDVFVLDNKINIVYKNVYDLTLSGSSLGQLGLSSQTYSSIDLTGFINQFENFGLANTTAKNVSNKLHIVQTNNSVLTVEQVSGTILTNSGIASGSYSGITYKELNGAIAENPVTGLVTYFNSDGNFVLKLDSNASLVVSENISLGFSNTTKNGTTLNEAVLTLNETVKDNRNFLASVVANQLKLEADGFLSIANVSGTALTDLGLTVGTQSIVNISTDVITVPGHSLSVGDKVEFVSTGTLPSPLQSSPLSYYVVNSVDGDDIKLGYNEQDLINSSSAIVNLTNYGTGEIKIRKIKDSEIFYNIWKTQNTTSIYWTKMERIKGYFEYYNYVITRKDNTNTFSWNIKW